MPSDRLTVLTGPPCGGKSTFAADRRRKRSLVVDFDALAVALGYPAEHVVRGSEHPAAVGAAIAWAALVKQITSAIPSGDVWVIDSAPPTWRLRQYQAAGARIKNIDPGRSVCLERACERGAVAVAAVDSWFGH